LLLKHQANGNSVKLYDKQGSVLRVEITLNRPRPFRVDRASERDPEQKKSWPVLRKGLGDLHRRAEICQAINGRYLEALASVRPDQTVAEVVRPVCRQIHHDRRHYRALNPWAAPDAALLEIIARGKWTISGFRNRDLLAAWYPGKTEAAEQPRQSGRVTRALARLRAHGVVKKVRGTYRYQPTTEGRRIVTALLAARQADVQKLMALAA
jgi:hypothetical protein